MYPIIFAFGPIKIYSYGLMYRIGIVAGFYMAERLATREGIDPKRILDLMLLMMVSIVAGGRIFYVVQHSEQFADDFSGVFRLKEGGQVFYGGLICSLFAAFWYLKRFRLPSGKVLDTLAISAAFGLAFGRVGCFLEGCCYGKVCDLPWAVTFPKHISAKAGIIGSPAFLKHVRDGLIDESLPRSLPVHPVQIYAALASLALFAFLLSLHKRSALEGRLLGVYLVCYSLIRFVLEFFRGDDEPVLGGMTIPQLTGIIVAAGGLYITIRWSKARSRRMSL